MVCPGSLDKIQHVSNCYKSPSGALQDCHESVDDQMNQGSDDDKNYKTSLYRMLTPLLGKLGCRLRSLTNTDGAFAESPWNEHVENATGHWRKTAFKDRPE